MGDEAIGNARTQSGGTRFDASLNYATEHDVRVKDNGVGIDPTFAEKG
jgi:nitrate/nitrite-specific signal transduction histidine kinase